MAGCECGTEAILIALGILGAVALALIALGSVGFNAVRGLRFLRRNTLRLVSQPRAETARPRKVQNGTDTGPGLGYTLWIGLLFAVLVGVIGASLYVIGGAA